MILHTLSSLQNMQEKDTRRKIIKVPQGQGQRPLSPERFAV